MSTAFPLYPIREERTTTLHRRLMFFHYADSDASGSHRASLNDEFYFPGNDIVFRELPSRREIVNLSTPTDVIRSNRCPVEL